MEIPYDQIAAKAAEILTLYVLPKLIGSGKNIAQKVGGKIEDSAAEWLWQKIQPKVQEKESMQEPLEDLMIDASDKKAREALEYQIEKLLKKDDALAQEIGQIIQTGAGSVVVGKDVNKSAITLGDHNMTANNGGVINVVTSLDSEKEKRQKAFESYLKSLQKNCYILPLLALGDDRNVKDNILVKDIYINLDTTADKDNPEKLAVEGEKARNWRGREKVPVSVLEAVTTEKRWFWLATQAQEKVPLQKTCLDCSVMFSSKTRKTQGLPPT